MFIKTFRPLLAACLLLPVIALAQTYPSPTFNSLTLQNPLTVSNGGSGTTSATGSGNLVLGSSPTIASPVINGTLTGSAVTSLLAPYAHLASPTFTGTVTVPDGSSLGTPSSLTLTNAAGLPVSTGINGLGTGIASALAVTPTGSGAIVLATSPSIVTPNLDTPSSLNLTNAIALPVTSITGLGSNVVQALQYSVNGNVSSGNGLLGSTSPIIFKPFITGFTDGSNALAGYVGEYISATGSPVALTTTTPANITSISLTAGDWNVSGGFLLQGSTNVMSLAACGYSTTSATLGASGTFSEVSNAATPSYSAFASSVPAGRINISSSATVYLVCEAIFSTGTVNASGIIQARRMR